MTGGRRRETMSSTVIPTKVPAYSIRPLELGQPFRVVPNCNATSISHWIWTAPKRRHDFGRNSFLQPGPSTRKADT